MINKVINIRTSITVYVRLFLFVTLIMKNFDLSIQVNSVRYVFILCELKTEQRYLINII